MKSCDYSGVLLRGQRQLTVKRGISPPPSCVHDGGAVLVIINDGQNSLPPPPDPGGGRTETKAATGANYSITVRTPVASWNHLFEA